MATTFIQDIFNKNRSVFLVWIVVVPFMAAVLWNNSQSSWVYDVERGVLLDNQFIVNVSKSIANGMGWGIYYLDGFSLFDNEISSGFVVFLPPAILDMAGFSRQDAKILAPVIINLLLLGIFLRRIGFFLEPTTHAITIIFLATACLGFMQHMWYVVLGEVPAALLVMIALTYVADHGQKNKHYFLGGLALGVAIFTKLLAIMAVPAVIMVMLLFDSKILFKKDLLWESCVKKIFFMVGAVMAPLFVGISYMLQTHGTAMPSYPAYLADYINYYINHLSLNNGPITNAVACYVEACLKQSFIAASSKAGWDSGFAPMLAGITALAPVFTCAHILFLKNKKPLHYFLTGLCLVAMSMHAWFYFNGPHLQTRNYFVAGFTGLVTMVIWVMLSFEQQEKRLTKPLAAIVFIVLAYVAMPALYKEKIPHRHYQDTVDMAAMINASDKDYILYVGPDDIIVPFILWDIIRSGVLVERGAFLEKTFDIDIDQYKNAYLPEVSVSTLDEKQVIADFASSLMEGKGRFLHVRLSTSENAWVLVEHTKLGSYTLPVIACATKIHSNENYSLLECKRSEIENYFSMITNNHIIFVQ